MTGVHGLYLPSLNVVLNMDKPVVLITGASRGIGAAAALAIAQAGYHVAALARTQGGLEELDDRIQAAGGTATLLPVDLLKGDALEGLGPLLYERFGRLDALVANAGMLGGLMPLAQTDPAMWDRVMALNVTANLRLVRTCDPLLRKAPAGCAIFVTSSVAQNVRPFWGAYAASKAALENMAACYAAEVAHTDVRVRMLDPGGVRTAMRAQAFPGEDPHSLPNPDQIAPAFVKLLQESKEAGYARISAKDLI